MNNSNENNAITFERILFFSDAVIAIVITLLILELKAPHIKHEGFTEGVMRQALFELLPKFLGFVFSFLIVGMMWIEHHRIFRFITSWDFGLIWRNLVFLLFVAFIPFPTALFSENSFSQTAFMLYAGSFALAAIAKVWVWNYAVSRRSELIGDDVDDETVKLISRRSWAVPIVCVIAIGFSFIAVPFGGFAFPLIPLVANLLYRKKKVTA